MWGLIKLLTVAAGAGAVGGAFLKGKVDTAIRGETPKKVKKSKVNIVEIPADVDLQEVNVLVKKQKKSSDVEDED